MTDMAREGLVLYHEFADWLEPYSDDERGRILTAMLTYSMTGEAPELTGNERFIWPAIRAKIDQSKDAYEATCEKNRRNIAKRYERKPEPASVNDRIPPNTTVNDRIPNIPTGTRTGTRTGTGTGTEINKDRFAAFAGDDKELLSALRDFADMRNKKKKPLTDKARDRLLAKLEKDFPRDQWVAVLNQSVDKGWADLYPLDRPAPQKKQTAAEYNARPQPAPTPDYLRQALGKI